MRIVLLPLSIDLSAQLLLGLGLPERIASDPAVSEAAARHAIDRIDAGTAPADALNEFLDRIERGYGKPCREQLNDWLQRHELSVPLRRGMRAWASSLIRFSAAQSKGSALAKYDGDQEHSKTLAAAVKETVGNAPNQWRAMATAVAEIQLSAADRSRLRMEESQVGDEPIWDVGEWIELAIREEEAYESLRQLRTTVDDRDWASFLDWAAQQPWMGEVDRNDLRLAADHAGESIRTDRGGESGH